MYCIVCSFGVRFNGRDWQLPYQKARSIHLCYYGLEERPADVFNDTRAVFCKRSEQKTSVIQESKTDPFNWQPVGQILPFDDLILGP